jgi:hypothetical protein
MAGMVDLDAVDGKDGIEVDTPTEEKVTPAKPDEPEADETTADDNEDETTDSGEVTEETPEEKKPSGSARLKAQVAELQRELEALRKTAPVADPAAHMVSRIERELGPAPTEADYPGDYLAYSEASSAYKTAALIVTRDLKRADAAAQEQATLRENAVAEMFRERVASAKKSIPDFDAAVQAATVSPTHPDTIMLIMESDKAAELAYYLSKNPRVVEELNAMSPIKQAARLGRLEAEVQRAKPKTETKAPAPVPALKGGANLREPDPERMTDKQFDEWYSRKVKERG